MKITPPNDERRPEPSVVPLVNVVFLLLVFFMLVGRLAAPEPLDIQPPRSLSGEDDTGQTVKILLTREHSIAINRTVVRESELAGRVSEILAHSPAASFQIKADANADAVWMIGIMETLRGAGVERLTLLTERGEP